MDGLLRSVGSGIANLVSGAFEAFDAAVRETVHAAQVALPGGPLLVVVFIAVVGGGWLLLKK